MRISRRLLAAPVALAALTGLAPPPPADEAEPAPRLEVAQVDLADSAEADSLELAQPGPGTVADSSSIERAAPPEAEAGIAPAWPAAPAEAAARPEPRLPPPAAVSDFFMSSDSDGTQVARAAIELGVGDPDDTRSFGVRYERAGYNIPGRRTWEPRDRVFLRGAEKIGDWQLRARVGTDGGSIIGSASIADDSKYRKELFVERDIVETRLGLERGLYSTFGGAAIDVPVDDRNVLTALAGVQDFTGDNVRYHLRGSFIHVLEPKLGLSVQLRGRWFRNSVPREYDYYSPRWYAEVLPVIQMRRFVGGWELVGAGGLGRQRDSGTDWRASRYLHARLKSPRISDWSLHGAATYTNAPSISGEPRSGYSYMQFSVGVSKRF